MTCACTGGRTRWQACKQTEKEGRQKQNDSFLVSRVQIFTLGWPDHCKPYLVTRRSSIAFHTRRSYVPDTKPESLNLEMGTQQEGHLLCWSPRKLACAAARLEPGEACEHVWYERGGCLPSHGWLHRSTLPLITDSCENLHMWLVYDTSGCSSQGISWLPTCRYLNRSTLASTRLCNSRSQLLAGCQACVLLRPPHGVSWYVPPRSSSSPRRSC